MRPDSGESAKADGTSEPPGGRAGRRGHHTCRAASEQGAAGPDLHSIWRVPCRRARPLRSSAQPEAPMSCERPARCVSLWSLLPGLALAALAASNAAAAPPTTVAIEGALAAAGGGPVADGNYKVTFAIYKDSQGGLPVWTEVNVPVAVKGGVFATVLGATTALEAKVIGAAPAAWLGVTVEPEAELPRVKLQATLFALTAGSASALDCSGCVTAQHLAGGLLAGFAKVADLSQVATSGQYAHLTGTPDLAGIVKQGDLADVAFSGEYKALKGAPVLAKVATSCGTGLVVRGLLKDGGLECVAGFDPTNLPGDLIDEVSNGLIANQFQDVFATASAADIPDNDPNGVVQTLVVPDVGTAQGLAVSIDLANSDLAKLTVTLQDPAGGTYTLYDKDGPGKTLTKTWSDKAKPNVGDLAGWVGKNPAGTWTLTVVDGSFLNNKADGQVKTWNVTVSTLSNKKVGLSGVLKFQNADKAPLPCTPNLFGGAYANPKDNALYFCNGTEWVAISLAAVGTQASPAVSCKEVLQKLPTAKDGLYWVTLGTTQPVATYCDMTTDGGGWTLASYGYRAVDGGADMYFLPDSAQGVWQPGLRDNKAAINASKYIGSATQVALTVNNGATPTVAGNLLSYGLAYRWSHGGYNKFSLPLSTTTCVSVNVTEIKSGKTFSAQTFADRPQVSCSGHTGGTQYERQFIGFNSATCYGACGSDPETSNGMIVWKGDGYCPTTSGGKGCPERAGSFAFWVR
ncbi:MAG: hypothetical protein EXR79_09700 [Myxococcales bacterium]|nr:hypothetical protein [Myxococcales bacterium]